MQCVQKQFYLKKKKFIKRKSVQKNNLAEYMIKIVVQ